MELNDLIKHKSLLQLEMNELDIKINKIKQDNIKNYSCKKCDVEIDTKEKYIRHMNNWKL